jgi:RNA polymerase sigma-70 factor (ECF subfamily)
LDEAEAIRLSQDGDRDAFRFLVERYAAVLTGTAYLMTHDRALTDDLTQEAFLLAWKGLPTFRPDGNFKAWIIRILVNHTISYRRKRRVKEAFLAEPLTNPADDPQERLLTKDERERTMQALESLPQEQHEALVLRYFSDMTVPEVAQALGWREGTVKSRLHRALRRLRKLLADDTYPEA